MEEPQLMPFQNQPFNGDTFIEEEFIKLRDQYNIKTVIETGSCLFTTTLWLSKHFEKVYTFEINEYYRNIGLSKLSENSNVESFLNNSPDGIKQILHTLKNRTMFFLDAHWGDSCPLLDELEVISQLQVPPVIVIHDFKTTDSSFAYDSIDGQPFDIDYIKEKLEKIYPRGYNFNYNKFATGAKRGVIYITPKRQNPYCKMLSIIDCFVSSKQVERKLISQIEWLKKENNDVLLVSNTPVEKEIFEKVDYFIYDHRNQLFKNEFTSVPVQNLWKTTDYCTIVEFIDDGFQKHGLSVLINLFNTLHYAKLLGYTHFQRFEVDDLFGEKSRDWIKHLPSECFDQGKKGLFYYNVNDISFHYFFCEIDYFLEKIERITCQADYMNFLRKHWFNKEFRAVENYIYENLKRNGDFYIWQKTGNDMVQDFSDTIFNTESSASSLESFYNGTSTRLYKKQHQGQVTNNLIVLTYNYHDKEVNRKILVHYDNGDIIELYHTLQYSSTFSWNELGDNVTRISIFENEVLLYNELNSNIRNYIDFY
jgi:hypothetical protein